MHLFFAEIGFVWVGVVLCLGPGSTLVGVGGCPVHNLWTVFFLEGWDGKRAGHRVIWEVAGLSGEFRYPLKGERERS